ncbi:MAG TPA: DUF3054 domain-containing protein [Propionibacteriaceae bacterium]|jgi:hypothetical protein
MRTPARIAIDLVLVVVFAVVGRASHGEALSLDGLLVTGWPFLLGCLIGSVLASVVLRLSWLREGLLVWAITVVLGMLLRGITGGGMAIGFLIVATIVLAVFLIGWRMVAWRITVARPDSGTSDPVATP